MDPTDDAGAGALPGDQPVPVAPVDPTDAIDAAAQDGSLVQERDQTPTPDEIRASVQRWWAKTSETADFKDAVEQHDKDQVTLAGGDPNKGGAKAQVADAAECTVNHVYRNGIQTVAMTLPDLTSVSWEPRELAEPLPGEPMDPAVTQLKRQARGLGQVMKILAMRYAEEISFEETAEAFVQDAAADRIAILKVMWQGDYANDQVTDERLPDEQDNMARLRYLLEQYHRGEFTKNDFQWQDIRELMTSLGKTQVLARTGLIIEEVPVDQWRCDPRVTGPENVYAAEWMRQDVLMSRAEVLSKWENIDPDDLGHAFVYALDESGRRIKQNAIDKTDNRAQAQIRGTDNRAIKDDDQLLVAEIYDAVTNTILVLVEGLEYPAAQYAPEHAVDGFFPYVVLVLNRFPRRLYGLSDTELQAKSQAAANRMMAGMDEARRAAQPRFAYDANQLDAEDAQKIANGEPWEMIPLKLGGKDIREAIFPLVGNHEFNQAEYDPSVHFQNMRSMAALPEQALGVTGKAKFSSEVQVASAGASILAKYRQKRVRRAYERLWHMAAQLILFNVGPDVAVKYAGPAAAKYWPAKPPDRQAIYETLSVKVKVSLDSQLDQAKHVENQARLFQAAAQMGVRVPADAGAKLFAQTLGEEEAADLFQPDPNNLVGDLAQALQQNGPGVLAPEAVQMLAQLGLEAQQQLAQIVAQQQAAQAQKDGGAPPAGGGPPAPPMPPAGMPAPGMAPPAPMGS